MRKIFYLSILILAIVLVSSMTTSLAQEPSPRTDFQIQNFSTTNDAAIILTYYNSTDGSALPEVSDTISAGSSKNYAPIPSEHNLPDDFEGSLVVSSDQPVAAVVNLIAVDSGDNSGATGGATYNSVSAGATTVSFPSVFNGLFGIINTYFYIQNLDSTNAADVTVTYAATSGMVDTTKDSNNSCQLTASIPPGSSVKFNQAGNPCLLDDNPNDNVPGFFGAATVNSVNGQLIAGALVQYDNNSILANNGLTAADASTELVAPLFLSNIFSTWSSFTVQNTGAVSTEVTVTFTPTGDGVGSECTQKEPLQAGGSFAFGNEYIQETEACRGGVNNVNTAGFVGSARVTSNSNNQPLVGIVNQVDLPGLENDLDGTRTFPDRNPPAIRGANASAYNAFNPANASSRLDFPLIIKRLPIPGATADTGMSIANVGDTDTTVTCAFVGTVDGAVADTSNATRIEPIAAGASRNITQNSPESTLPERFVGSATCTASENGLIVGTINQVGGRGDLLLTSEGFQQ